MLTVSRDAVDVMKQRHWLGRCAISSVLPATNSAATGRNVAPARFCLMMFLLLLLRAHTYCPQQEVMTIEGLANS